MVIAAIQQELAGLGDASRAAILQRFFQTGPGQYAEGDRFRGIRVPVLRGLAKKYRQVTPEEAGRLLPSGFHEDRLLALFLLIQQYYQGGPTVKDEIHRCYLENTRFVNNWDLVDASAPHLVGHYLAAGDRSVLTRLAGSPDLWERRIAILATFFFIKQGDFADSLRVARLLLGDPEDLLHKAVGWMLREVQKRENSVAEDFLRQHYREMPRTMLRYAIERLPEARRQAYLKGMVG